MNNYTSPSSYLLLPGPGSWKIPNFQLLWWSLNVKVWANVAHQQVADCQRAYGFVYMCMNMNRLVRITNKQPWTKLPFIAAAKREDLPVMGRCPRRGKLWIQTNPWWSLVVMQSKKNIPPKLFFYLFFIIIYNLKTGKCFLILWSAYSGYIQVVKHYIQYVNCISTDSETNYLINYNTNLHSNIKLHNYNL